MSRQTTIEQYKEENIRAEEEITSGRLPEAAKILVQIVEKDPENWRAFNNMGILSWAQQAWVDAYTMFKKSVSLRPDYADALINLFDAALKLKKIEETLPYFELACSINPDMEEITIIRDSIVEQGDLIYTSKRALQLGVYSPLLDEAQKELESGNQTRAMELFLQANDTEGPTARAYCGLGIISYYQKRFDDAFTLFTESIKCNPTDTDTFLNLLDAAQSCDRRAEACKVYETYCQEIPELVSIKDKFVLTEKKD